MNFTKEEADKLLSKMSEIVDSLDYPVVLLLATPGDALIANNELINTAKKENEAIYCSANCALIKLIYGEQKT